MATKFSQFERKLIQKHLLAWFSVHQRDLPWRCTYDPYQVWVAEIMLQQTQVKTVLPYFERWMKALPTMESVASADEQMILKLWEGLGYYSRARNLQKAACTIVEKHGGKFPSAFEAIRALPGIGRYTAGAIASIAFNEERPILDGNVIRVLTRLQNDPSNIREARAVKRLWKSAEDLIPSGRARDFNQGLMELGALVCTPKNPNCRECPLQAECKAYAAGTMEWLPNRGKSTKIIPITVAVAILQKANKIFIQRRQSKGLMGGLWEFPGGKVKAGESPKKALEREIQEELRIGIENIEPFMRLKHAYTKYQVDLHCFKAQPKSTKVRLRAAQEYRWVRLTELQKLPFPAANVRLIQALQKAKNTQ